MQTTTTSTTGIFNLDPCCSPWEQRLNTLLSVGLAAGADLVEVFLERTDHLGVLAEQDKITSVSPAFGMGAGIRVFRGARDGFVSTNDLSDTGLTEALDQALAMLQLERSSLSSSNAFQGLSALRNFAATKNDWLERTPNLDVITQRLLEGTQCLQRLGQHLEVRRGNFSRDWQEVLVAASDGTFARDIRLHQSSGLSVLAADGDHRASIARRYGTTDKPNDLCDWNIEASAQEVCASASTMLRADYVDGGQMPVVLANRFGGVIFHEACGHLLETTQIERGTTPFAESIGAVASRELKFQPARRSARLSAARNLVDDHAIRRVIGRFRPATFLALTRCSSILNMSMLLLASLEMFQKLDLSDNGIGDLRELHLANFKSLTWLRLANNRITYLNLTALHNMNFKKIN